MYTNTSTVILNHCVLWNLNELTITGAFETHLWVLCNEINHLTCNPPRRPRICHAGGAWGFIYCPIRLTDSAFVIFKHKCTSTFYEYCKWICVENNNKNFNLNLKESNWPKIQTTNSTGSYMSYIWVKFK